MDRSDAQAQFHKAGQLYLDGRYEEALLVLNELEEAFPTNHRLLRAKARTLAKLGHRDEALVLCDRLLEEFNYEKIRPLRNALANKISIQNSDEDPAEFEPSGEFGDVKVVSVQSNNRRFRIKPVRLILLILICAGMYFGYINYWIGGGLIAAYFILRFALGALLMRLFSIPFRMKGKALSGAQVEFHGVEWTEKPVVSGDEDYEEGDEEDEKPDVPLRYAWIEVTITPAPRSGGFVHWEPGELMLAPARLKVRNLNDMDKCFSVHDVKLILEGQVHDDEAGKYVGPQRIRVLAGIPETENVYKFAYYGECFGEFSVA